MEDDYEPIGETVDGLEVRPKQSLAFLNILCLLTWLYFLVSSLVFLFYTFNVGKYQGIINAQNGVHFWWVAFFACFVPFISALGALLLFLKKRWGFIVYVIGHLFMLTLVVDEFILHNVEELAVNRKLWLGLIIIVIHIASTVAYATQLSKIKLWQKIPSMSLNDL